MRVVRWSWPAAWVVAGGAPAVKGRADRLGRWLREKRE